MAKKIVVCGGNGFLGQYIASNLTLITNYTQALEYAR